MKSKLDRMLQEAGLKERETWTGWLRDPKNQHVALAESFGVSEAAVRRWRHANGLTSDVPRILLLDIESSPILAHVWGLWQTDVIRVERDWKLLTVSYSWYGSNEYLVKQLPDFTGYRAGKLDDKKITQFARDLIDDADYFVAHNGDAFDMKKIMAKIAEHNIDPPSPTIQIDTLKIARRNFKMSSNRLDSLGEIFGLGRKIQHSGFQLWLDCMAGKPEAWEQMCEYARQDVVLLESVFNRLRPWVKGINWNLFVDGDGFVCEVCGSDKLTKAGKFRTMVASKPAWQCDDCGHVSKER